MGYRRALLVRWSRRDRLAVLVVAVTVAFLTGTTLLLLAAGGQTAAAAAEYGSAGTATFHDDPADARAVAGPDGIVLPVANVTIAGEPATLVGVPAGADVETERPLRPGDGTTSGELSAPTDVSFEGTADTVTVTVVPRNPLGSVLPPSWYVTDPGTVEQVGETGAFVVRPGAGRRGVPLLGALAFFVHGTSQAVRALAAVAGGAALLVGVTVFSVSRMSVRDRLPTIRIVRATGAAPRTVLGVFTLRAALLTGTGIALGYAVGVVVASGAVTAAVAVGLPTTLSVRVSARAVGILVPLYLTLLGVGVVAGGAAVRPAVRASPGRLTDDVSPATDGERRAIRPQLPSTLTRVTPTLLRWRALVPTTATLSAFVAFVVVVAGLAGAAGPVVNSGGVTVTDPDAVHPVASDVPEGYADALRARGIDASAEILLFEVIDGQPLPARGATFEPFANVTDAHLLRGRPHEGPDEAMVGRDLARSLGVDVGDTLTLGGSTRSALTRVRVVGVFAAPGPYDDQVLVSLPTARHLSAHGTGSVQFVRADRLPESPGSTDGRASEVTAITAPSTVVANGTFTVRVTVRNPGFRDEVRGLTVSYRGQERSTRFTIKRTQTRTFRFQFGTGSPGTGTVRAGNRTAVVEVRREDALDVTGLPDRAPPGSEPLLRVTNAAGAPVAGATVTVGNGTGSAGGNRTTDGDGFARVRLSGTGARTVRVVAGDRTAETRVTVAEGVPRDPTVSLSVVPESPSVLAVPEAQLSLSNPWNRTLTRTVELEGPGTARRQSIRLAPGDRATVRAELATRAPGTYAVRASLNGSVVDERTYRVTGDERVLSALATGGRTGTTGVGQAIEVAFGNLRVVVGALLGLAALMTVGGTTATFAGAVHARRRTVGIHRATGARPLDVLLLVGRDAAIVGSVASVLAVLLAQAGLLVLSELGFLTAFGVRLSPTLSPVALVGTVLGGVALTVVGAGLATGALLLASPADLLDDRGTRGPTGDADGHVSGASGSSRDTAGPTEVSGTDD